MSGRRPEVGARHGRLSDHQRIDMKPLALRTAASVSDTADALRVSMIVPKTCYAKSGELSIAYQVVGEGPFDVVFVPGFNSNLDIGWEMPVANLYRRIASFARLIIFDKRGTGLSDRNCGIPSLEERIDDVRAVMAAVGSERASIFGFSEGSAMALMFAATYPDRTRSLVLYGAQCKCPGWVIPPPREDLDEVVDKYWGTGAGVSVFAPSLSGNPSFRELWARYERAGASPSAIKALVRMNSELDVGPILGSVKTPCLLLHRIGDRACNVEVSRSLAKHLPNARYIELPGDDHAPVGDTKRLFDEIEEFLTGSRPIEPSDRVLATVLFTDIVESTKRARELGDTLGTSFWPDTIKSLELRSDDTVAVRSRRWAMDSSRRLTARPGRYVVHPRSLKAFLRSVSTLALDSISAR